MGKYDRFKEKYESFKEKAGTAADEAGYWADEAEDALGSAAKGTRKVQRGLGKVGEYSNRAYETTTGVNPMDEMEQAMPTSEYFNRGQQSARAGGTALIPQPYTVEAYEGEWAVWNYYTNEGRVVNIKDTKQAAVEQARKLSQANDASGVVIFDRSGNFERGIINQSVVDRYLGDAGQFQQDMVDRLQKSQAAWEEAMGLR